MEAATSRPPPAIPLTNPITPGKTPKSLSNTPKWFNEPLSSSPQSGNLTMIEVVPPTPPSRFRPVNLANDPTSIPASPISPTSRISKTPKTPAQPLGTPRTPAMGMRTPGVGRRVLPGGVANRVNRMSAAFYAGTPPPAFKTLPAAGDGRRPISHAYVKDGRRTSIATDRDSAADDHRRSGLSARQSIVTLPDASPATHPISNIPIPGTVQISTIPLSMPVREADLERAILNAPLKPILKHTESATGTGTTSEDTYLADRTWRTSESSHSSASESSMRRVDPLTLIERRRRRDFTIGSHHPAHPPPNTPATPSLQSVEQDPDEIPEVTWNEMFITFREGLRGFWKSWSDMPWIAEPCVATLVIPQAPNLDVKKGEVVGWYRKRPTLGQILGEEPMDTQEKGVVNGYYVGDSAPVTGITAVGEGYEGKEVGYEADDGRFDGIQDRFHGGLNSPRADDSVSITETIVPPPIPRKEAKWFPRRPEPMHDVHGEFERERWDEPTVMRSSRYPSGVFEHQEAMNTNLYYLSVC